MNIAIVLGIIYVVSVFSCRAIDVANKDSILVDPFTPFVWFCPFLNTILAVIW